LTKKKIEKKIVIEDIEDIEDIEVIKVKEDSKD